MKALLARWASKTRSLDTLKKLMPSEVRAGNEAWLGFASPRVAPDEAFMNQLKKADYTLLLYLIHSVTDPKVLNTFSKNSSVQVRREVARNTHLSEETFHYLYQWAHKHDDGELKRALGQSFRTHPDRMDELNEQYHFEIFNDAQWASAVTRLSTAKDFALSYLCAIPSDDRAKQLIVRGAQNKIASLSVAEMLTALPPQRRELLHECLLAVFDKKSGLFDVRQALELLLAYTSPGDVQTNIATDVVLLGASSYSNEELCEEILHHSQALCEDDDLVERLKAYVAAATLLAHRAVAPQDPRALEIALRFLETFNVAVGEWGSYPKPPKPYRFVAATVVEYVKEYQKEIDPKLWRRAIPFDRTFNHTVENWIASDDPPTIDETREVLARCRRIQKIDDFCFNFMPSHWVQLEKSPPLLDAMIDLLPPSQWGSIVTVTERLITRFEEAGEQNPNVIDQILGLIDGWTLSASELIDTAKNLAFSDHLAQALQN